MIRRKRLAAAGLLPLVLLLLAVQLGCNAQAKEAGAALEPRAQGGNSQGELVLLPLAEEKKAQLGAPSCMGQATDYRIEGSYDMRFRKPDGSVQTVAHWDGLSLIRPDLKRVALDKLAFDSFDAFVFTPAYADCHALEFRLYGVSGGEAFPFVFRGVDGQDLASFSYAPGSLPRVEAGRLVVDGGYAAGMEAPTRYTFRPDAAAKAMVLVKQEAYRL